MPPIVLYVDRFFISPYAFSCFVSLEEKGLEYHLKPLGLDTKEHHAPEYRDRSLTGRVPALRDGDYWLSESSAIDEYLSEAYPSPKFPRIYPEDLQERARCRQLQAWIRSDLLPLREERGTHTIFYEHTTTPLSPAGVLAADRLIRVTDQLTSAERPTLFKEWCIADADLGLMLQRLASNGHPLPKKVKAYADAQWKRPSVRKWVEMTRAPYVPY